MLIPVGVEKDKKTYKLLTIENTNKIVEIKSNNHNKVSHMNVFWFSSACKSYVYTTQWSTKCAIALCLRKQYTYLKIKVFQNNKFLCKKQIY